MDGAELYSFEDFESHLPIDDSLADTNYTTASGYRLPPSGSVYGAYVAVNKNAEWEDSSLTVERGIRISAQCTQKTSIQYTQRRNPRSQGLYNSTGQVHIQKQDFNDSVYDIKQQSVSLHSLTQPFTGLSKNTALSHSSELEGENNDHNDNPIVASPFVDKLSVRVHPSDLLNFRCRQSRPQTSYEGKTGYSRSLGNLDRSSTTKERHIPGEFVHSSMRSQLKPRAVSTSNLTPTQRLNEMINLNQTSSDSDCLLAAMDQSHFESNGNDTDDVNLLLDMVNSIKPPSRARGNSLNPELLQMWERKTSTKSEEPSSTTVRSRGRPYIRPPNKSSGNIPRQVLLSNFPAGKNPREKLTKPIASSQSSIISANHSNNMVRSRTTPSLNTVGSDEQEETDSSSAVRLGGRQQSVPSLSISGNGAAWRVEDEETSIPAPMPSLEDTPFSKSSSQLYYPNTSTAACDGDKKVRGNGGSSSFSKLARRLSQKGERRNTIVEHTTPIARKPAIDKSEIRKAHSLESLHPETTEEDQVNSAIPASPSLQNRLQRTLSSKKRGSSSSESDGSGSKVEKDKNRRTSKANFSDITALFDAVHNQEVDRAKYILDCNGLDINAVNSDDFTPLDVAIMVHNTAMAKLLLAFGARENPKYLHKDARASKLNTLINEAERQVQELTSRAVNNTGSSQSVNKETDKRLRDWEWKHRLFRRMKATFEHARPPEPPQNVNISVTSSSSISVQFDEPSNNNLGVITRYKIEWSVQEDFSQCSGEHILYNNTNLSYKIQGLVAGKRYFVRVSAFNLKGFGIPQLATPPFAIPSCWRDRDGRKSRTSGQMKVLEDLFKEVKDARLPHSVELKTNSPKSSPNQVRKTMKKSIKNFFQFAPKFHKLLKRAVYVCTLLYSEDKVLVTTEDHLPIVEVDDNYPSNMYQDFLWFMKVACTWEDVDVLRGDLEKALSTSPSLMFRNKLLQAVALMQTTLGIQDLGQVYYEPIRDDNGSTIFVLVKHIKDSRSVQSASLKWLNLGRVQKRRSVCFENPTASEILLSSIPEKIFFSQVNQMPHEKGLYLGYMKLRSSVDTIRIQVQAKSPNVLPCVKVRDNSNVTQDEWDWLYQLNTSKVTKPVTKVQEEFQLQLADAARTLAKKIGVSEEETLKHRLCDYEVIDLNDEVSFIIMVPPVSDVCTGPGHLDNNFMRGSEYVSLPVQVFEMVHTTTYHNDFIRYYSRLSSILEMENLLAQQSVREAFHTVEMNDAKQRQQQIADFQQTLESAWKGTRWIMDVIQYARDKQLKGGVPLSVLFAPPPSPVETQAMDTLSKGKGLSHDKDKHDSKYSSRKISRANIGILRVYPAYDTGLASGTSVKLQVTTRTSSREIINLVIEQLNKAIQVRGLEAHIYPDEEWQNFGLVAAISGKEHSLPDDFNPLVLQNPWTKGKLYIKHKEKTKIKIKSNSMV
ncbi:uncharacterized protein LOC117110186 isoform X2 [Anneissia japonica]|nr:uncharacterized protein LOC117110186 isoform X2 [Anneissia japonica]XP_033108698.1 uncharacterized protein LOC117110186 isoform X2 [Anneissia japonica]